MAAWNRPKYVVCVPLTPAIIEFRIILRKRRNFVEMGKLCGLAQNSAFNGKLWSLIIVIKMTRCCHWPFSSNSTKTTSTRWSLSSTWATVRATCFSVATQQNTTRFSSLRITTVRYSTNLIHKLHHQPFKHFSLLVIIVQYLWFQFLSNWPFFQSYFG